MDIIHIFFISLNAPNKNELIFFSQAHSSVEKAGLIGLVRMRYIESDDQLSMRGEMLVEALARDREEGLVPFFVSSFINFLCLFILTSNERARVRKTWYLFSMRAFLPIIIGKNSPFKPKSNFI